MQLRQAQRGALPEVNVKLIVSLGSVETCMATDLLHGEIPETHPVDQVMRLSVYWITWVVEPITVGEGWAA